MESNCMTHIGRIIKRPDCEQNAFENSPGLLSCTPEKLKSPLPSDKQKDSRLFYPAKKSNSNIRTEINFSCDMHTQVIPLLITIKKH